MLTKLRYDLKLSPDAPRPFIIRTHTSWPAHPFPGGTVCRPFLRQHNFNVQSVETGAPLRPEIWAAR